MCVQLNSIKSVAKFFGANCGQTGTASLEASARFDVGFFANVTAVRVTVITSSQVLDDWTVGVQLVLFARVVRNDNLIFNVLAFDVLREFDLLLDDWFVFGAVRIFELLSTMTLEAVIVGLAVSLGPPRAFWPWDAPIPVL